MISEQLQIALHDIFVQARGRHHKWISVEHLLLHLIDLPDIQKHLRSRGVDETALRGDLERQVSSTEEFPAGEDVDTQPTTRFQHAIQYAILRAQKVHRMEVTPLDILDTVAAHPEYLAPDSSVQTYIASFK